MNEAGGPRMGAKALAGIVYHLHARKRFAGRIFCPVHPALGSLRPQPDVLSPVLGRAIRLRRDSRLQDIQSEVLALATEGARETEVVDAGKGGDLLKVGGPDEAPTLLVKLGGDDGSCEKMFAGELAVGEVRAITARPYVGGVAVSDSVAVGSSTGRNLPNMSLSGGGYLVEVALGEGAGAIFARGAVARCTGGWVRWCARLILDQEIAPLGPGLRVLPTPRGPFLCLRVLSHISTLLSSICARNLP